MREDWRDREGDISRNSWRDSTRDSMRDREGDTARDSWGHRLREGLRDRERNTSGDSLMDSVRIGDETQLDVGRQRRNLGEKFPAMNRVILSSD